MLFRTVTVKNNLLLALYLEHIRLTSVSFLSPDPTPAHQLGLIWLLVTLARPLSCMSVQLSEVSGSSDASKISLLTSAGNVACPIGSIATNSYSSPSGQALHLKSLSTVLSKGWLWSSPVALMYVYFETSPFFRVPLSHHCSLV